MPVLLDTHAWVWWVTGDRRLTRAARRAIDRAASTETLMLSLISLWEVAKKVEKGQMIFDRPLASWLDAATMRPGLQLVELTRGILVGSCQLPQPFHGDPTDQMIVATARDREAPLVTGDERIQVYPHVRTIW